MIEFCPKCGNMLRKKPCLCGYIDETDNNNVPLGHIWDPPTSNIIYCKITTTPIEKIRLMLNKRVVPDKLKEVREKVKKHLYSCLNCVYYHEDKFHCKIKNKFLTKDSICKSFEPFSDN
ncbi:hypothetical protein LCGC14_0822020 [marine sediment metagenome]|uniref:Uncharacterized protein n=1 Tax=marine sediment metagenome TaxID=412755 RepID=A0A0F9SR16_9ZZZZ|nr:MAG: hypothetical protein Lokiarch_36780 [Candidatus Lokiarchaeum sp. GC14_75]